MAPKPKGFIPELTDVQALMWIEQRLADEHLPAPLREDLEKARQKALTGALTDGEFREIGRAHV